MPTIDKNILTETSEMLKGHLLDYQQAIDEAYCEAENALSVNLKAKFAPKDSGIKIDTSIEFVAEKIKDAASRTIGGTQKALPFDDPQARYREILFRNFSEIRAIVRQALRKFYRKSNSVVFRRFKEGWMIQSA